MTPTAKTETLGAIAGRQLVVPTYLRQLLAQYGPEQLATSHSAVLPFGTYLLSVTVETN